MNAHAGTLILILSAFSGALGQHITNVISEPVGDKIIIHYDLTDSRPDQVFEVALYCSSDNFSSSLRSVNGNGVGTSVTGGNERVIIWDVLRDVPELTGEFSFEVRAFVKSRSETVAPIGLAREGVVSVGSKDDAYPIISQTLMDYINEAKDFKDAFQMLGIQSTESRQALARLTDATEQYNRAFEKLNKERLAYENYVTTYWNSPVKSLEFKSLLDYALGDVHGVDILTLNQELTRINDIANGRVKHLGTQKKELEKDIGEAVLRLDKRLQELERRTNRMLYALTQD